MNSSDAIPLARQSLVAYTKAFRPDYKAAKIHFDIAEKLEAVEAGRIKRLMIFVPPRHGKSMLTSEHFPPWFIGRNPEKSIACATYAQDLADDFGRKVRNQMVDDLYAKIFPACTVSPDTASVSRIATEQHGNYFAVGIGGPLTGRGAHVLVIDDPHKDRADADSIIMRKRAKDWFQSVAYTRLMPDASIILMQTRWHVDDLAGWLLKEHSNEQWDILNIPALSDNGVPWPEAYSAEVLERTKKMIGPREWSALYMQTPIPGGGGEFKKDWPKVYRASPDSIGGNKYILVDPAGEQRPDNDYTSMWVVSLGEDGNYYWLDGIRDRLNLTERGREVMRLHRKWKPLDVRYERYGMMGDIQYIQELQERENYRFTVTEVAGRMKKNDRIRRLIPLFEQGKFYFPEFMNYTDREGVVRDLVHLFIEEEMAAFPAGLHDDMLDSLARIAEPDLPLIWPRQVVDDRPKRYAGGNANSASVWAR